MEQLINENPSQEEALVLVNSMMFPQAAVGDKVKQYNYWFELTETGWIVSTDPAQGGSP